MQRILLSSLDLSPELQRENQPRLALDLLFALPAPLFYSDAVLNE